MTRYSLHKADKNHQHQVLVFCLSKAFAFDSKGTQPYEGLTKTCFFERASISKYARIKQLKKLGLQPHPTFKDWSVADTRVLFSILPSRQESAR